jgi:hypothetical protein
MGLTQKLGTIPLAVFTDSSNNVGIGAAANASFKLQVTGATNLTGALTGTSASFTSGVTLATTSGVLAINTTGRPAGVGGGDNGKVWSKQATTGNYGIATIASATDSFTYIGHNGTDALLGTSYGTTGAYTDLVIQTADVTRFRLSGSTGAATFTTANLGHSLTIQNTNSGYYSTSDYLDNAGSEKLIVGYANSGAGALASKAIIYGTSGVGLNFYTNGSTTAKMVIDTTGAATFSSSITSTAPSNALLHQFNGRSADNLGQILFYANNGSTLYSFMTSGSSEFILGTVTSIPLNFYAGNAERMRITSGGNVGIGTTPNSWASGTTALQIGTTGTLWNRASDGLFVLGSNSFFNGSADIQITTGTSNRIYFLNGGITFDRAVSTAAGSNTPWQTSMTITSGGCVAINNPSDKSQPLSVQGFIDNWTAFLQANTATSQSFGPLIYGGSNSNDWCIYAASAGGTPYFRVRGDGATFVAGSLSKGSGSFRIDHPLESMSETHELVHSFIEGPQADLIYRGKLTLVNGKAQANIDEVSTMTNGTFEALCREVQCFTTNESGWDLVKGKVIGNIIYIESQNVNSTDEISWMVIGERKDKHMIDTGWTDENGKVIVEPLKIDEPENLPNNNKQ